MTSDITNIIIPVVISVGISILYNAVAACKTRRQLNMLEAQVNTISNNVSQIMRAQQQQQPPPQYFMSPQQQQQYIMPPPYAPGVQVMTI